MKMPGLRAVSYPGLKARGTARALNLAAVDMADGGYVEEERLGHLLPELVEGFPMALSYRLVGCFRIDAANQQPVFPRHDFNHPVALDLEKLEEGLVENQSAAIADLL